MSLKSRSKNMSLGKIGFLPAKCPQCPHPPVHVTDGKRGPLREQWDESPATPSPCAHPRWQSPHFVSWVAVPAWASNLF